MSDTYHSLQLHYYNWNKRYALGRPTKRQTSSLLGCVHFSHILIVITRSFGLEISMAINYVWYMQLMSIVNKFIEGCDCEIDLPTRNEQNLHPWMLSKYHTIQSTKYRNVESTCITEYEDIDCPQPERYILSTTEDNEDETIEAGNVTNEGNRYYNTENGKGVGTHNQSATKDNEGDTIDAGDAENDDEEDADGYLCPLSPVPPAARNVGPTDSMSPDKGDDCPTRGPTTNTPTDD